MPTNKPFTQCGCNSKNGLSRSPVPTGNKLLPLETTGELFPDGSQLELVADSAQEGRLSLALWNGALVRIAQRIEYKGQIYRPADLDPTIIGAVHLPKSCCPYRSTRKLWEEICGVITNFTGLPEKLVLLVCSSAFASWFVDCTSSPICLSIFGPRSNLVPQLLRILSLLYRRPLSLGAVGLTAICELPMEIRPSLLIDKSELDPAFVKFLRASSARDLFVPFRGEIRRIFCAKAVYTEEPIVDPALLHTIIPIPVTPMNRPLPILNERAQQEIADEFQPQLLSYRLKNLQKVRNSDFDVPNFVTVRELARNLGCCVIDDQELQAQAVRSLTQQDDRIRVARSIDLNGVVVEVMLFFCHVEKQGTVHVGEIADAVNTILLGRGESLDLKPKAVAARLRNLGIVSERLDAAGRGIVLLNSVRERVHSLARDLAVPTVRANVNGCLQCRGVERTVAGEDDAKTNQH